MIFPDLTFQSLCKETRTGVSGGQRWKDPLGGRPGRPDSWAEVVQERTGNQAHAQVRDDIVLSVCPPCPLPFNTAQMKRVHQQRRFICGIAILYQFSRNMCFHSVATQKHNGSHGLHIRDSLSSNCTGYSFTNTPTEIYLNQQEV